VQDGDLNPPDPAGTPLGRTHPADMSFFTFLLWQRGQGGLGSLLEKVRCSKQ
jgi:hypothetical protein